MHYDDYDFGGGLFRVGLKDRSPKKCRHTHKTRYSMHGRRPYVGERSKRIGKPCLHEGVPFSQTICDKY